MSVFRNDAMKLLEINVKIECGAVSRHRNMTIIFKHTPIKLYYHIRKNCSENINQARSLPLYFSYSPSKKSKWESGFMMLPPQNS